MRIEINHEYQYQYNIMLKYAVNATSTRHAHPFSGCILYGPRSIHNDIADAAVSRLVRDTCILLGLKDMTAAGQNRRPARATLGRTSPPVEI